MSILYPLMALGVLAGAVPIWLHLRRRDERNLVEFSTLRFLDDQPLARARPLWPRNWPLLILRLLGLLLLVAAFTWPYVEGEETVIVEESRVYILDNTLSHQVNDAFTSARDRVADELDRQDVRTQIGVVELSSTAARWSTSAMTKPLPQKGCVGSNLRPSEANSSTRFVAPARCWRRRSASNVGLCCSATVRPISGRTAKIAHRSWNKSKSNCPSRSRQFPRI